MNCTNAICVLDKGKIKGQVLFHQCYNEDSTIVDFKFSGLKPHAVHAIHIHETGDLRRGCASLGPHWNPHNTTHGSLLVPGKPRHGGDLINNLKADENGEFRFRYRDPLVRLRGNASDTVLGRSVVVHEGVDDLGLGGDAESLKTGNAGSRMLCAIIGYAENN